MKGPVYKGFGLFFLLCLLAATGKAQPGPIPETDFRNTPAWISMIDDSTANYFTAIRAYETWWKFHEKPMEEEEGFMNQEKEKEILRENDRHLTKKEMQEMEIRDRMVYQCKRFENWKREVLPFVQEDGRILTLRERAELWKKQQEESGKKQ